MGKQKVAVIFGGRSSEHEVSLRSAASVIQNLDNDLFEIIPIAIHKSGEWFVYDMGKIQFCPETNAIQAQPNAKPLLFTPYPNRQRLFDVAFLMAHGGICEDGSLQGVFELMEVPYVGADVLGSAIGMDKITSKRLAMQAGILTSPFEVVTQGQWLLDAQSVCDRLLEKLDLPLFVKPNKAGSSVGIHKVEQLFDLRPAIEDALLYHDQLIVEQGVNAREIEIAVLENKELTQSPLVSLPGEVVPHDAFYSYEAKLNPNGETLHMPAQLSAEITQALQARAAEIFTLLQCSSMARVDFFLEKETDRLFFNEINTIPGFTSTSLYPKLWEITGVRYSMLLTRLIELAIARRRRRNHLKTNMAATIANRVL